MRKKTIFLILLILFVSFSELFAQRIRIGKDYDWDDFEFWEWGHYSRPMIELSYGFNNIDRKNLNGDFSENAILEIKLGYSSLDRYDDFLVELKEHYFFASKINSALHYDRDISIIDYDTELWRGGLGMRSGTGYYSGDFAIIPYNQHAITWIRLKDVSPEYKTYDGLTVAQIAADKEIIDRYNESYRFAMQEAAGVKIELGPLFSFNASYEVNTVFPRVKTWEFLGSYGLQYGAEALLYDFIDEIEDSTPEAAPLVSVLLKGALQYSFYLLRKEDMNWPFSSETPLTYENFQIGVTFNF